jgi:hypothetical protein
MTQIALLKPSATSGSGALRVWLCGVVMIIYFATFAGLLELAHPVGDRSHSSGISMLAIVITIACMMGSVATTALFVFLRRGA